MAEDLTGKTIAILAADGVEQVELEEPRQAVEEAGGQVELLSIAEGEIQAMNHDIDKGDTFPVDKLVGGASVDDYAGLILPGGTINPDNLRADEDATSLAFEAATPATSVTLSLTTGAFSAAKSAAWCAFSCTRGSSFTLLKVPLICS